MTTGLVPVVAFGDLAPGGANDAAIRAAGWTPTTVVIPPPPSVLNPESRWAYTAAIGPMNPHEDHPHGLPSTFDWYNNGHSPNPSPPSVTWQGRTAPCTAMTVYGMVYLAASGIAVPGVQFVVDGLQGWIVDTAGRFTQVQAPGGAFGLQEDAENFQGGINATAGQTSPTSWRFGLSAGYMGHFYPNARGAVPVGWSGFAAGAYRVRMIVPSGYNGPEPRYVACAGVDWWLDSSAPFDPVNEATNPGATLARFCFIPADGSWVAVDAYSGTTVPTTVPTTW